METKRFTIRSFDVEAVQVTEENIAEVAKWCGGEVKDFGVRDLDLKPYIDLVTWGLGGHKRTLAFPTMWVFLSGKAFKVNSDREFQEFFVETRKNKRRDVLELIVRAAGEDMGTRCDPYSDATLNQFTDEIMRIFAQEIV